MCYQTATSLSTVTAVILTSNKQTNRERNKQKARPLDFVIMENEILASDKHALVFPKMDSAIHHINYYPKDKD